MAAADDPSISCPSCGRLVPGGTDSCPYCAAFLPGVDTRDPRPLIEGQTPPFSEPTAEDGPPPSDFGITSPPTHTLPRSLGRLLLGLGIALVVGGIFLIAAGDFVNHSVQSFNQQCGTVPGCHPETNASFDLYVGGIVLLVVGWVVVVLGYRRSESGATWAPPDDLDE